MEMFRCLVLALVLGGGPVLGLPFLCNTTTTLEVILNYPLLLDCHLTQLEDRVPFSHLKWYGPFSPNPFFDEANFNKNYDEWRIDLNTAVRKRFFGYRFKAESMMPYYEGIYKCVIETSKGEYTQCINVRAIEPPSEIVIFVGSERAEGVHYVKENQNVTLDCIASGGNPKPNVTWSLNSIVLKNQTSTLVQGITETRAYLGRRTAGQNGQLFTCEVRLGDKWVKHVSILPMVRVMARKVIILASKDVLWENEEGEFSCTALGAEPLPELDWFLDGKKVLGTPQNIIGGDKVISNLKLKVRGDMDKKELTCASRQTYHDDSKVTIHGPQFTHILQVITPALRVDPQSQAVITGEQATIHCKVIPQLPGNFTWYRFGTRRYEIGSGEQLTVNITSRSMAGTYYCEFKDETGRVLLGKVQIDVNPSTLDYFIEAGIIVLVELAFILLFGYAIFLFAIRYYDVTITYTPGGHGNVPCPQCPAPPVYVTAV